MKKLADRIDKRDWKTERISHAAKMRGKRSDPTALRLTPTTTKSEAGSSPGRTENVAVAISGDAARRRTGTGTGSGWRWPFPFSLFASKNDGRLPSELDHFPARNSKESTIENAKQYDSALSITTARPRCIFKNRRRIFALFLALDFLIYCDRGIAPGAHEEFARFLMQEKRIRHHPEVYFGVLQSVFIGGLGVAAPILSFLAARTHRPVAFLGFGLSVWLLSIFGCALAGHLDSVYLLFLFRTLSGVGEGAFTGLITPILLDACDVEARGAFLGLFFGLMPLGVATGFVVSATIASQLHWKFTFLLAGALAAVPIFSVVCYAFCKASRGDSPLKYLSHSDTATSERRSTFEGDHSNPYDVNPYKSPRVHMGERTQQISTVPLLIEGTPPMAPLCLKSVARCASPETALVPHLLEISPVLTLGRGRSRSNPALSPAIFTDMTGTAMEASTQASNDTCSVDTGHGKMGQPCVGIPSVELAPNKESGGPPEEAGSDSFVRCFFRLLGSPMFCSLVVCGAAQAAVAAALSSFGTSFLLNLEVFQSELHASAAIGSVGAVAGATGTFAGGWLLFIPEKRSSLKLERKLPQLASALDTSAMEASGMETHQPKPHSPTRGRRRRLKGLWPGESAAERLTRLERIRHITFLIGSLAFVASMLMSFSPLIFQRTQGGWSSLICLAVGLVCLFMTQSGLNLSMMLTAPDRYRSLAISVFTLGLHLFGDVPGPIVVGWLKDTMAPHCKPSRMEGSTISEACRHDRAGILRTLTIFLSWTHLLWLGIFGCYLAAKAHSRSELKHLHIQDAFQSKRGVSAKP